MLKHFHLKTATGSLEWTPAAINIFIGPNNCGKSTLLKDVYETAVSGHDDPSRKFVQTFEFSEPSEYEDAWRVLFSEVPPKGHPHQPTQIWMNSRGTIHNVHKPYFEQFKSNVNSANVKRTFANSVARHFILRLDGKARLNLLDPKPAGLIDQPTNTFTKLFRDDVLRKKIRDVVHDAIGLYILIERESKPGQFCLRLSVTDPDFENERTASEGWIDFVQQAMPIEDASDGIKAFIGILIEVMAGSYRVITIDEPEAFLHPSLQKRLAREIAPYLGEGKQLFVATHSPDFLKGIMDGGQAPLVFRLHRRGMQLPAIELLDEALLRSLRTNPHLRSENMFASLFHQSVVICEGNSDRAIYQLAAELLEGEFPGQGLAHTFFVNANGKQNAPLFLEPLRRLGIPSAVLCDLDVLRNEDGSWRKLTAAARVPAAVIAGLEVSKSKVSEQVNVACGSGTGAWVNGRGIHALNASDNNAAKSILAQHAEYGIFVTESGALEGWFGGDADLPRADKQKFFTAVLGRLIPQGEEEKLSVNPADDDLGQWLSRIGKYFLEAP
jgi:predicted ATPase